MTPRAMVIAEIGSCHDGELQKARGLVHAAADAGADYVKMQYWSSADRMARRRHADDYRKVYEEYASPREWISALADEARLNGIGFACSVYLPEDVWAVAEHADTLKVASFEANDPELLVACRAPLAVGKRVVVSLGMDASAPVARRWLVEGVFPEGTLPTPKARGLWPGVLFLHCVSAYPAPANQLRLRELLDWGMHGRRVQGFSDHSDPELTWTGALAVAAGAIAVEAHLRLDETSDQNPDAPHAMRPHQFRSYVEHIRFAESCLGEVGDTRSPCEEPMKRYRVVP